LDNARRTSADKTADSNIAVYVSDRLGLQARVWDYQGDSQEHELMWIKVQSASRDILIGALYHPPKPIYQPSSLLDRLEYCVDALAQQYPRALIILAGDFNSLDNDEVISRSALNALLISRPSAPTCLIESTSAN